MVDDFGEKNVFRKDGLNMMAFNCRLKFVNVYMILTSTRVNVFMVPALKPT